MPVGNSDRGVGLGAGEVMLFADFNMQEFDWWHDKVNQPNEAPVAFIPYTNVAEDFEHSGLLENKTLNLGMTIGLTDYWNVTLSQIFSERCMIWEGPTFDGTEDFYNENYHKIGQSKTVHHRTECSDTDFFDESGNIKAYGGTLGDAKINFKYLLSNAGKGTGNRVFFGGGFIVPSKHTITESPWKKNDLGKHTPHRHFYLSDGAYKMFAEVQFFKKRKKFLFFGEELYHMNSLLIRVIMDLLHLIDMSFQFLRCLAP